MTLVLMKSNLTVALTNCIRDCAGLIRKFEADPKSAVYVTKAMECRATCLECLEAYEATQFAVRGLLLHAVTHACNSFLRMARFSEDQTIQKCVDSCRAAIEECGHLTGDQDFATFLSPTVTASTARSA